MATTKDDVRLMRAIFGDTSDEYVNALASLPDEATPAPEPVGEQAHRSMESQQRRDLIATVLRNSAHANLSIATCQLLANAIHAAVVAPLESKSNNHQALVDALTRVIEWVDAGCDPSRKSLDAARAALAACEGEGE